MKTPTAPRELSVESRRLWTRILKDWEISDSAHLEILKIGLLALDRAERCRKRIDRDGEVGKDRFGKPKAHCLLNPERDARAAFLNAIKQLGLDPSSIGD